MDFACCDCRKDVVRPEDALLSQNPSPLTPLAKSTPRERCGCGIIFRTDQEEGLILDGLVPGGPASLCGLLRRGDKLVEVDGVDIVGKPTGFVGGLLLGPAGTTVRLSFDRPPVGEGASAQRLSVFLERKPVLVSPSVQRSPYSGNAVSVGSPSPQRLFVASGRQSPGNE